MRGRNKLCRHLVFASVNYFQGVASVNLFRGVASAALPELTVELKRKIEKHWSPYVGRGTFKVNEDPSNKMYVLSMFPYPSGNLHLGHVRVYTIGDAMAWYYRLNGKNVFQPIGFDAFGLPAENAAIERKISADAWTRSNIGYMRDQLKCLDLSFDWDHEIITCDPSYYKFTQFLFGLLFKEGLVYQKEAIVNWDPGDQTVLADEQIDTNGISWRSGCKAEKKLLKQWFIATTRFADALYSGLDGPHLQHWRDIINLQKHWIGECNGFSFMLPIIDKGSPVTSVKVWVRYPELMRHASFLAVRSSSLLDTKYASEGKFSIKLLNPMTNNTVPIIINDEVEYDEGCDVKLVIPGVDKVCTEFIRRFNLDWKEVGGEDLKEREAVRKAAKAAGVGGYRVSSKLKDWLISRQRKWGTPIPVVHCPSCGPVLVPGDQLPVLLPESQPPDLSTECPQCGQHATRESDTMDTFVDSSWYYLRYLDPKNDTEPFSKESRHLMPVDLYVGGKEHAVLHLYYARFMSHFLHSIGLLKSPEPFTKLLVQGMVMGRTFRLKDSGKFVPTDSVEYEGGKVFNKDSGELVIESWEKMSKSKQNGVEPNQVLETYGIDTTRLLILSDVAPTSHKYWKTDAFSGTLNWQKRIWALMVDFLESKRLGLHDPTLDKHSFERVLIESRNFHTRLISFNYGQTHQLSVAIAKLQGFTNSLKKFPKGLMASSEEFERSLACLVIMMSPLTPHFASHLWQVLGETVTTGAVDWSTPVLQQSWPQLDPSYPLPVFFSVNKAVKDSTTLPYQDFLNLTPESASQMAFNSEKVNNFIGSCDVLSTRLSTTPSYDATFNITIDHLQRAELLKSISLS